MPLLSISIDAYGYVGKVFGIIFTCSIFGITIYHIIKTWRYNTNDRNHQIWISFGALTIAIVLQINLMAISLPMTRVSMCEIIRVALPFLYSFWKLVIYTLFTVRVYEPFKNSFLKHDPRILIFYLTIFALWSVFNIIYGVISTQIIWDYESYTQCYVVIDTFLIISTVSLDGTAGIILT